LSTADTESFRYAASVGEPFIVEEGSVVCYRLFDVGDAIALDVADKHLRETRSRHRPPLARERAGGLVFSTLPLDVDLGRCVLDLPPPHGAREVALSARLYDYGAVSVRFELGFPPETDLAALLPLCDHLFDSTVVDAAAQRELASFLPEVEPAITSPRTWKDCETYTVIFVRSLRGGPLAAEVLASPTLAKLLLGETDARRLSEQERADVVRHAQSYFDDDLVVVDWNSAFVLEPSSARDIPDILEFANSQLLELRYYDDLLDAELRRIWSDFAQAHRSPLRLFWSPYGKLARAVQRRVVEVNDFTERVDNAVKVIGDFYLARVYGAAVRRLQLHNWKTSVDRKQALIAQTYELLKGEVDIRRSTLMEMVVILLIVFELITAIRGPR
jgi:hypothetical protein